MHPLHGYCMPPCALNLNKFIYLHPSQCKPWLRNSMPRTRTYTPSNVGGGRSAKSSSGAAPQHLRHNQLPGFCSENRLKIMLTCLRYDSESVGILLSGSVDAFKHLITPTIRNYKISSRARPAFARIPHFQCPATDHWSWKYPVQRQWPTDFCQTAGQSDV